VSSFRNRSSFAEGSFSGSSTWIDAAASLMAGGLSSESHKRVVCCNASFRVESSVSTVAFASASSYNAI
jgi:hypothetical protein